jgi:hypothetical protein
VLRDSYGFAGLRSDGSGLLYFDVAAPGSATLVTDCDALACTEQKPAHGKFIDASFDNFSGCGLIDDGTVQCWGLGASLTLPDVPLVKVAYHSLDGLCGIERDGNAECWLASDNSHLPGIPSFLAGAKAAVQIDVDASTLWVLQTNGELFHAGFWVGEVVQSPLRYFDALSRSGLTLGGEFTIDSSEVLASVAAPPGPFVQLSAVATQACALRDDGSHVCWGDGW